MSTPDWDDIAIQTLSNEGAQCGDCGDQPGDRICPACEKFRRSYVAALRAAGWAPRAETFEHAAAHLEQIADQAEARVAEHYGAASGIGPGSADMVRDSAAAVRDLIGLPQPNGKPSIP
ncbi:hypothetical protein [Streptomyces sp. NPDC055105]|uniref:hypothetical protein n=1 Tax=Streptomyces sp. NPDC055105 TaxID=3365719 RepID=UPI0037D83C1C